MEYDTEHDRCLSIINKIDAHLVYSKDYYLIARIRELEKIIGDNDEVFFKADKLEEALDQMSNLENELDSASSALEDFYRLDFSGSCVDEGIETEVLELMKSIGFELESAKSSLSNIEECLGIISS